MSITFTTPNNQTFHFSPTSTAVYLPQLRRIGIAPRADMITEIKLLTTIDSPKPTTPNEYLLTTLQRMPNRAPGVSEYGIVDEFVYSTETIGSMGVVGRVEVKVLWREGLGDVVEARRGEEGIVAWLEGVEEGSGEGGEGDGE